MVSADQRALDAAKIFTPEKQNVIDFHRRNLYGGTGLKNADGSITTFYGAIGGDDNTGYTILPTYWHGQIREFPDAVRFAIRSGIQFPRYKTLDEAKIAEQRLHTIMASDTAATNPKMSEPNR
jgi:hypothetical protein